MTMLENAKYKDCLVVLCIVLIILLCLVAVLNSNGVFFEIQVGAQEKTAWCKTQQAFEQVCQSFWYRTLFDPPVAWSFWYSMLTFILVATALASINLNRKQNKNSARFFELEMRPWLKVEVAAPPKLGNTNGRITANISLILTNVGRMPAFQVTRGWLWMVGSGGDLFGHWNEVRNEIEARMPMMGFTLLPGEIFRGDFTMDLPQRHFDNSRQFAGLFTAMFVVSYKYKSSLSSVNLETSRMYSLDVDGGMPLHMAIELTDLDRREVTFRSQWPFEVTS